jgi:hypothetical protein
MSRTSAFCLTLALVGVTVVGSGHVAGAESNNTASAAEQLLAERFAPILFIANDGSICKRPKYRYDPYEPVEVEIMLADERPNTWTQLRIDDPRGDRQDGLLLGGATPTAADLSREAAADRYIDIVGLAPTASKACARYAERYALLKPAYASVTYVTVDNVLPGPKGCAERPSLRLRYWFFYFFNHWRNSHEGDWEHIAMFFDQSSPEAVLASSAAPSKAAYAKHGKPGCKSWSQVSREGWRPHVYVARGSHGSYYSPGKHPTFLGGIPDWAPSRAHARRVLPGPIVIPTLCRDARVDSEFPWLRFAGRWGQEIDSDDKKRGPLPRDRSSGPVFGGRCR